MKNFKNIKSKWNSFLILFLLFSMNGIGQEEAPAPNNDLNWTSNISYDFNGNTISKNVNYYNTLGNATQNQYWDILTNKIWNSETKYDYH